MNTTEAAAKAAAMLADAALPDPDPVPSVSYLSHGTTLIVGCAERALPWAEELSETLNVSVLLTDRAAPAQRPYPVSSGSAVNIKGWLGAFDVTWKDSPDLQRHGRYDLIFDLSREPLIALHQPPPGYFAAGDDPHAAALQLTEMVGEFEKPKYFRYKEKLCAHSRNNIVGCNACIDICSAQAIGGHGNRIQVNPHLCVGCGACATVCPSGALGYAYPDAPYMGRRVKTMLTAYAREGGTKPVLLFHSAGQGREWMNASEAPDRILPIELHHAASTGIDLWLAAIAYGASGVAVLVTDEDAPQYIDALREQMAIAQTVLSGLGYAGTHFQLIEAKTAHELQAAMRQAPLGQAPGKPALFNVAAEKRNALDFVLDHLYQHAPLKPEDIALAPGAPYGAIQVNRSTCTLCMSCVGACPESALMDSASMPELRFVERNCVQCGLCAKTCPEDAITLVPRLSFAESSKKAVVLNETQPFHCIRCNKPFGTLQMVEAMVSKLAQHSAFSGNLDRIRMCADCRVIDMMENKREATIVNLRL